MSQPNTFDPNRKWVRVTELRPSGLISFEFSVGEPEIFVELILPALAFIEFCARNQVVFLPSEDGEALESVQHNPEGELHWRLRDVQHIVKASWEENKNAD